MTKYNVVEWSTRIPIWTNILVKWVFGEYKPHMRNRKAERLGGFLHDRRIELGFTARYVSEQVGVDDSTIMRLERGEHNSPSPTMLARIADILNLNVADVFAMAEYAAPTTLPSFTNYLRLRYPELDEGAIDKLEQVLTALIEPFSIESQIQAEFANP
jgi:transcriptional regulator with XRE-family HTH domain